MLTCAAPNLMHWLTFIPTWKRTLKRVEQRHNPLKHCVKSFAVISTFTAHLSRTHKNSTQVNLSEFIVITSHVTEAESSQNNDRYMIYKLHRMIQLEIMTSWTLIVLIVLLFAVHVICEGHPVSFFAWACCCLFYVLCSIFSTKMSLQAHWNSFKG